MSGNFLQKNEQRKSGKALTIQLKGKIIAETPSTVKTAAGAVYRKNDIAKSKVPSALAMKGSDQKRSPTGEEPRSKLQKTARKKAVESESNDEDANPNQREYRTVPNEDITTKERFQSIPTIVTSRDTEAGGGLNLAVKKAKPNNAGPSSYNKKGGLSKPTAREARKTKAAKAVNTEPKNDKAPPNSSTLKKTRKELNVSLVKAVRKPSVTPSKAKLL